MTPILSLLFCAASALPNDTIPVTAAQCTQPVVFHKPYCTDSLDMQGQAYSTGKILDENAAVAQAEDGFGQSIAQGTALPHDTVGGTQTLSALRFHVDVASFTKARLDVKKLKNYKVYLDGKLHGGNNLTLTPGRTTVTLLTLTEATGKDTFNVSLIGENLKAVTVGSDRKEAYTMSLMMHGDHYRNVSLSPSGKYMVTVYYYTQPGGKNLFRTVLTETATGRELMRRGEFMSLSWLPRQDVLYYMRNGVEGREMVSLNPQTMLETVLATHMPDGGFTLSPSGDYAIFSRTQEGRKAGQNGLKLLDAPDDRMPGWRNRNALYRYDLKTRQMMRLTFGQASAYLNDISADGCRLLVSYSRMEPSNAPFSRSTLVEIDAYEGTVDTVFADTAYITQAQYAPDGQSLLIKASPAAFDGIGLEVKEGQVPNAFDYRLYIYDVVEKKVRPVLRNFKPSVENVTWAYGDGNIYFQATDGCDVGLFRLDPKTEKTVRFDLPVTVIQGWDIAEGQKKPRAVFFGQTGERARDMYTCILSSEKPKTERIGEIDFDEIYNNVAIGECRDWSFRASRGDSVKGFYFLPPDFDATKKYPLIVYYYGGCTPTAKTLEFHYPFQVLAGQGYVVYVCEPSGAIGYGQEFAARHVNTWGMESADDIIEGTKAFLNAHPYVDAARVGCMGASYGGFMTQYLQTRTDIFAAAISHAGISNIASYWGGGYWGYTYGEVAQYGSFPWNNPDLYVKQSPLFNADKIHTPLLLLHGTVDTNVPPTESQQLFTALRILGRTVSYIQIDGENHVITDYNKRLAWQNVIFAWFAKWLKQEPLWWETLYPEDK